MANPEEVPILRKTEPLQRPQNPGTADLFFKALAAKQEQGQQQMQAQKILADTVMGMSSLMEKKRQADLEAAQGKAMLDLRERILTLDTLKEQRNQQLQDFLMSATPSTGSAGGQEFVVTPGRSGPQVKFAPQEKMIPGAGRDMATMDKITAMEKVLDEQESALEQVPSGRVMGTYYDVANRITGAYPQVAKARGLSGILIPMVAKLLAGEAGALAEQEQQRAKEAIAQLNGTAEERAIAIRTVRDILATRKGALAGRVGTPAMGSGGPVEFRTLKNGEKVKVRKMPDGRYERVP